MRLVLVGTSHHHAPIELRERVALSPALARSLAGRLGEAVCLSTCNRTELYVAAADADAAAEAESAAVASLVALEPDVEGALYRLHDEAAALHLFRVAAGLDSLVPGEGEILGQVREAYEAGTPGPLLDRLFRHALHAGKKVRAHTAIAESPVSVSGAAAALAEQVFGDLHDSKVLVVGAGETAELAARNLRSRGARITSVANRSQARGAALAEEVGAELLPLGEIEAGLAEVDVVVSSTSAPQYVLTRELLERVRRRRPLLLVDLAVPRDVDPRVGELDGCYLYDIDDLEGVVAETLAGRRAEAQRAETIVATEAEAFRAWQASRDVVPAIASLRARADEIRRSELQRAELRLGQLTETQRQAVEALASRIVEKLLHLPTVRMKQAAAAADGVVYAEAVRHLFGLGEDER
jgi:glutamyl-tRNA reductase